MALVYDFENDLIGAKLTPQLKEELRQLYRANLGKTISLSRISTQSLGIKTQRMRSLCITAAIEILQNEGGYKFESLTALKEKHIHYLLEYWVAKNHARGTLENKITYLATLASWIGKPNIVKSAREYEQLKHVEKRRYTATHDKSWEARGIDPQKIIGQIALDNPFIAVQLALQITFGLRTEESMLLRPEDAIMRRHRQVYLMISEGTKGGRPRRVEVTDEQDLDVIHLAEQLANKKSRSTIPVKFSLNEWKNLYYYTLAKYGLTKKNLGVTAHGLRHQYMQNLYQDLTGEASPIRGGEKPAADILAQARQIITQHAGHSRVTKSNAYIGSHAAEMSKKSKDLSNDLILARLQECEGNKMKAAQMLNCSRSYLYQRLKEIQNNENA